MANNNSQDFFATFQNMARGILDEKNLVPAVLSGLTLGMFSYVAIKGKTIRKARDIIDDVVTGMAGLALKDVVGGGLALGSLSMFVPAYAEIGNMIAESVITVAPNGTEDDVIADGDIMIASAAVAITTALAYLFIAPSGDGPISSRLFGGV